MPTINVDASHGGISDLKTFGGNLKVLTGTFDFDSSYPTGGEACDLSQYFKGDPLGAIFAPKAGYVFEYDATNKKVKAYYADYDAAADGALIEVANTTNLSAVTGVPFIIWGW